MITRLPRLPDLLSTTLLGVGLVVGLGVLAPPILAFVALQRCAEVKR